tara:strand:- start:407 stop:589 length:183 start_codon:yes stop_codon:yes gene_type:complete
MSEETELEKGMASIAIKMEKGRLVVTHGSYSPNDPMGVLVDRPCLRGEWAELFELLRRGE